MENPDFLKYFINEEIYLINPEDAPQTANPETAPQTAKPAAPSKTDLSSDTSDQYLVVVQAEISEKDVIFLHKIFGSVNVTPDMLKIAEGDYQLSDFPICFFFGTAPEDLEAGLYQQTDHASSTVVLAHSLSEIAGDQSKKRRLWTVLKSCFD